MAYYYDYCLSYRMYAGFTQKYGQIFTVSAGLVIVNVFLSIFPFANTFAAPNSNVMLLPFDSSFGSSISSGTLASGNKFLVPIMRTQADQNTLLSIYRPFTDLGDYVLMHPDDSNIAYALQLKSAAGNMGVEYFSLSDIVANAPTLEFKGVNFISYDLEKNLSPASDLTNPILSMQKAAAVTKQHGLKFMASPSHLLTDLYYSSFAKVSDLYNLQAQVFESNPSQYSLYVHNTISKLDNAHPGMPVSVETSTARGTVSQMEQCFSSVADVAAGSSTWYTDDIAGYTALKEYLSWFENHYN